MTDRRLPEGPAQELLFGGILEWRGGDYHALQQIVARINRIGLAQAELDADGGRHSILFDDRPVDGSKATPDALDRLIDGLQELIDASDDAHSAESTLHCSAIHPGEVVETLIAIEDGRVHPVSRIRPRLVEETAHVPVQTVAWRKVVPLGLALLVAFGLIAWQSGYLDRVLAAAPAELEIDNGPFGKRLFVTIDRNWGNYEITIARGAAYPATVDDIKAERAAAKERSLQLALSILEGGQKVYVQLLDSNGGVMESAAVELRALVEDPKGNAVAKIRGRIGAKGVRLSLSKGERKQ